MNKTNQKIVSLIRSALAELMRTPALVLHELKEGEDDNSKTFFVFPNIGKQTPLFSVFITEFSNGLGVDFFSKDLNIKGKATYNTRVSSESAPKFALAMIEEIKTKLEGEIE